MNSMLELLRGLGKRFTGDDDPGIGIEGEKGTAGGEATGSDNKEGGLAGVGGEGEQEGGRACGRRVERCGCHDEKRSWKSEGGGGWDRAGILMGNGMWRTGI